MAKSVRRFIDAESVSKLVAVEVGKYLPHQTTGVNVAIPSTSVEKMRAICGLVEAVRVLAHELGTTNVEVHIRNNSIHNATGNAINVETEASRK